MLSTRFFSYKQVEIQAELIRFHHSHKTLKAAELNQSSWTVAGCEVTVFTSETSTDLWKVPVRALNQNTEEMSPHTFKEACSLIFLAELYKSAAGVVKWSLAFPEKISFELYL